MKIRRGGTEEGEVNEVQVRNFPLEMGVIFGGDRRDNLGLGFVWRDWRHTPKDRTKTPNEQDHQTLRIQNHLILHIHQTIFTTAHGAILSMIHKRTIESAQVERGDAI